MLLQTLKTLIKAGTSALRSTCGVSVSEEHITQIRQGHLSFPSLGELKFSGGTLTQVYLGCDESLGDQLAEKVGPATQQTGLQVLPEKLRECIVEEMDTRRPRGWVENQERDIVKIHSGGNRSFGFRFQTDSGQFYLMAEVPSRAELDLAKGGEFIASMVATYFPKGWFNHEVLKSLPFIDNFLVFLRKTEVDIQVEVPGENEMNQVHTGVLLESGNFEQRRALCVSIDDSDPDGHIWKQGDVIKARVGVQDRALIFFAKYLGSGDYPVHGSATIKCVYFSLPAELKVEQRRRAFRINPPETISVEMEFSTEESPVNPFITGRLADLSFSGARIMADRETLINGLQDRTHVLCRVYFPDESKPLEIVGVIRRASTRMVDRDCKQDEIGLEFLIKKDNDRDALEFIRQYVLSQQRNWLSQRVHVAGVDQW